MRKIHIEPEVRKLGIREPVGCIIRDIDTTANASELDTDIRETERFVSSNLDSILQSEEVTASKELFARLGYPDQRPAGEQLVRQIAKKELNRHNNVVDAYNVVGGRSGAILGMHDVSQLTDDVRIRRADGGETMLPIFHDEPEIAAEGDLIWESGNDILALLGPVSRDADRFKVDESTTDVLLMVPGNEKTTEEYNRSLCESTYDLIQKSSPGAEMKFLETRNVVAH